MFTNLSILKGAFTQKGGFCVAHFVKEEMKCQGRFFHYWAHGKYDLYAGA